MGLLDLNEDIQDICLKTIVIDFIFDYYKYNKDAYVSGIGGGVYLRRDDTFELECNMSEDELPKAFIFLKSSDHNHWKIVIDENLLQSGKLLTNKDDLFSIIYMKFVLDYMSKENQS